MPSCFVCLCSMTWRSVEYKTICCCDFDAKCQDQICLYLLWCPVIGLLTFTWLCCIADQRNTSKGSHTILDKLELKENETNWWFGVLQNLELIKKWKYDIFNENLQGLMLKHVYILLILKFQLNMQAAIFPLSVM